MSKLIDDAIAAKLVFMFSQSITETKAFKLGIVDEKGNKIKEPKSKDEKDSYSLLARIVFKLKRLMASKGIAMTTLALALTMFKEETENIPNHIDPLAEELAATNTQNIVSFQPNEEPHPKVKNKKKKFKEFIKK